MKEIKLFYYKKNLGDELNEILCETLFHVQVRQVDRAKYADAVFIGSNLEKFLYYGESAWNVKKLMQLLPPLKIWGTGFIEKETHTKEYLKRRANIYALRGKHSKKRMEQILETNLNNIVLGDPGLLASELLIERRNVIHKTGIIPHYIDKKCSLENISLDNSIVIDVQDDPIKTIKEIASCETIISSSLHGLIIADSLNIPNVRIKLSDNIVGGDYKYDDYYSVFNIMNNQFVDIRKETICNDNLQRIIDKIYVEKNTDIIKKELINSFPY